MAETDQDKSERATPFKLHKARQKGLVARGMDLGFLIGTTVLLGYLWIAAVPGSLSVGRAIQAAIIQGGMLSDNPYSIFSVIVPLFSSAIRPLLVLMGSLFGAVLLFELLQTGVVFSFQPLKPDFSKMNPAQGLKRLFTLRLLLETAKNILKLCLYISAAYLIVRRVLTSDVGMVEDARGVIALMMRAAIRLLAAFCAIALFFVAIDQLIVRRAFSQKMSMSRREVRREAREREGDPRLKQKRKKLHAEFSKLRQSLHNLKGADVIITNPEHIAVALRYDRAKMAAPRIVSLGIDRIAQHLKRMALLYGIPVVENRVLARALYSRTALNKQIPEYCFVPVAEIYNSLRLGRNAKDEAH
jgi:flagellar biosynthetic protein FlhB